MKRLLIISNNPLSYTNNNGKTLLSFIENNESFLSYQLFFSGEIPRVSKYNYFRISDKDILKGFIHPSKRGNPIKAKNQSEDKDDFDLKKRFGRNTFTLFIRDLIWWHKWKSKQLFEWLDEVDPDAIFFVAGDTIFSYDICEFIQQRYKARLTVYVTDDYIMPRYDEGFAHKLRRYFIKTKLKRILCLSSAFYTVSELMKKEYLSELGKESFIAVNMTEDLQDRTYTKKENEIILTYTGSFYYKRFEILGKLAREIKKYNENNVNCKVKLMIFSNIEPSKEIIDTICISGASEYRGSLNREQLKRRLNTSDVLVFVESFDKEQAQKVKYSLSTKVPEYMSIGKPILAIGPRETGSLDYLSDVAVCIYDSNQICSSLKILSDYDLQVKLSNLAREKYLRNHDKKSLQAQFLKNVFGGDSKHENN